MLRYPTQGLPLLLAILLATGCGRGNQTKTVSAPTGPSPEGAKYVLAEEPAGAKGVIELRQESKDGEEIVLVGRVGGSKRPLTKGQASFLVADAAIRSCDQIPGDNCTTPWDYCCEPDLAKKI